MDNFINGVRQDFSKRAEQQNKEIYAWEEIIETLYYKADKNLIKGVEYADSIIKNKKNIDSHKVSNLHTIVGELYYDNDSITLALNRFRQINSISFDSPRNLTNRAACFVKQGDLEKAMELLVLASNMNKDYKWYIGNLYEIKGEIEKAIIEYDFVYQRDKVVYANYNKRIEELKKNPNELMTSLHFKDRRKRTLILLKGVDTEASHTQIGEFEIETK